jgi:hypothetical protein
MLDDATGKTNLIDFDCFVFQSPTLEQTKLLIRDGGSKGTPGYIPDWLCKDPSKDLAPLGDRFARDMLLVEILGFREGDPIELSPLYWTEQEDLLDDIKRLSKRLELPHLQEMKVFEASESERPSSFELAERLGLSIDNNVQQTLDAPPVWPAESAGADSHDPVLGETKSSLRSSISVPIELPTCEELPQFLTKQADRAVIELGKAVLPLLKAVGIGLAGIALTVIWVMVLVWLLLNLALPANLIACGGMIYGTHFLWERPELLKKYLHLD